MGFYSETCTEDSSQGKNDKYKILLDFAWNCSPAQGSAVVPTATVLDLEPWAHFGSRPHFTSGTEYIIQRVKNWLLRYPAEKNNQMLKFSKRNGPLNIAY